MRHYYEEKKLLGGIMRNMQFGIAGNVRLRKTNLLQKGKCIMKTMKTDKMNNSAMRKLIPATSMLLVSSIMLASSTYAWFTMSREVEVTNLQMTATVPEDIQLSLGKLTGGELGLNTGTLTKISTATNADNGNVDVPTVSTDWSNLADISKYYQFGKMIPASSTTGANIYFTPNATGVGKTVATDAAYYDAAVATTAQTEDRTSATTKYNTTVHAMTAANDTWSTTSYKAGTGWNTTEDDGYYIDVPVWFRTSSEKGASLSVQAYVKPKTASTTENANNEALYRAVRVAVLDSSGASLTNIIPVADGWDMTAQTPTLKAHPFDLGTNDANSIVNYYTGRVDGVTNGAVKAEGTGATSTTYGAATMYNKSGVISLSAGSDGNYGAMTKVIIRIWLEGEDPDCWNDTAGQDWSINLKFNNETTNANGASNDNISGVDNTVVMTTPKEPTTP